MCAIQFIHSFRRSLMLRAYEVPLTILGARETAVIRTDKNLVLHITCILRAGLAEGRKVKGNYVQSKKGVYCTEKHTAEKGDGVGREVASLDLVVREGLSETIRSDLKLERERWVSGDFLGTSRRPGWLRGEGEESSGRGGGVDEAPLPHPLLLLLNV